MKYDVYLTPRAKKQYKKFDVHMRHEIRTKLSELEQDPSDKGSLLHGIGEGLRKIRISHAGVQYRAVYDVTKKKKEVLVIFIGTRENFYRELRRFLA